MQLYLISSFKNVTKCVWSAVLTKSLKYNSGYGQFLFYKALPLSDSRRPFNAEVRDHSQVSPYVFVADGVASGQDFHRLFRFSPVNIRGLEF